MDADKVRELIARAHTHAGYAIPLADACEALLAERDKRLLPDGPVVLTTYTGAADVPNSHEPTGYSALVHEDGTIEVACPEPHAGFSCSVSSLVYILLCDRKRGDDACDEVDRLRARVAELEAALEPFADNSYAHNTPDNHVAFGGPMVTVGDYRRAIALLAKKQPPAANTLPTPIPGEPPETP